MFKIFVIGVDGLTLSSRQQQLLNQSVLILGSKRFAPLVADFSDKFCDITPLHTALSRMRQAASFGNVAVLASGDPLFYGIGRRLLAEFPADSISFFPALSSLQRACALFRLPWEDAKISSLHGRTTGHLPGLLLSHGKHLLFTDGNNSPNRLADSILEYLALIGEKSLPESIRMQVAEDIGMESERVFTGTLAEARNQRFSDLNIVCLQVPGIPAPPSYRFGLGEELLHHSRGLITKNEVRAATLHSLRLVPNGIFWDIGAGSGSLSIEAARSNPGLTVYAVEHKEKELHNIKNNIVKFRCFNIVPVFGRAPEVLGDLPAPQRVFIGGSGGKLPEIVTEVADRLDGDGILVVNAVIEETMETAPLLLQANGFSVQTATVQVWRTSADGVSQHFNPITIITGSR